MNFDLPVKLDVGGREYDIRSDYRVILEICTALNDPDLNQTEKVFAALDMFYPELDEMPADDYQEAVEKCFWFISCPMFYGIMEEWERSHIRCYRT